MLSITPVAIHKEWFCVLAAPLSAPAHRRKNLQKDAPSDRSSPISPLQQDEWENILTNTFWIQKAL